MMRTPIADFLKKYADSGITRFHMPGHKGKTFLGPELYDITEVRGADSFYEADGIIAESEENASRLFGSGKTLYSAEGSSQCIRAMVYLAACESMRRTKSEERPLFIAARNVHKAFIYGAALADADVRWLYNEGEEDSLCACHVKPETLDRILSEEERTAAAVYITCPDYLGNMNDVKALAEVCHSHDTVLAVDNAHGAYLHFLKDKRHPLDLGADICCDSAHKTLPVITGGAYLHIGKNAPESFSQNARQAMALFGSTSPSYLIMGSLDLCNEYLDQRASAEFQACAERLSAFRKELTAKGWDVKMDTDPLRVTIREHDKDPEKRAAGILREKGIECEYEDPEYTVLMISPQNTEEEVKTAASALGTKETVSCDSADTAEQEAEESDPLKGGGTLTCSGLRLKQAVSIREAVFAPSEMIDVENSAGRICASPVVACPPAVPVAVSGEIIDEKAVRVFRRYGIRKVSCLFSDNFQKNL